MKKINRHFIFEAVVRFFWEAEKICKTDLMENIIKKLNDKVMGKRDRIILVFKKFEIEILKIIFANGGPGK